MFIDFLETHNIKKQINNLETKTLILKIELLISNWLINENDKESMFSFIKFNTAQYIDELIKLNEELENDLTVLKLKAVNIFTLKDYEDRKIVKELKSLFRKII